MSFMESTSRNRVYIVDDSAPIRARLVQMVERGSGAQVVGEASTARDAIAGIRETLPAAVVLDLNLLGPSGFEVLKAIHPQHPAIVFIVLTNHAEPQYERACRQQGASYFLDKTTQFDRVPEVLRTLAIQ